MNNNVADQFLLNPGTTRTQYGAVCWRVLRQQLQVLLVTSRDTGRWIIPKGWPIAGQTPEQSAAREAWEEAGVEGRILPTCIGLFGYDKIMGPTVSIPCIVAVFPLQVSRLRNRYPEHKERRRKWFAPEKAAEKVGEAELSALLVAFTPPQPDEASDVAPQS